MLSTQLRWIETTEKFMTSHFELHTPHPPNNWSLSMAKTRRETVQKQRKERSRKTQHNRKQLRAHTLGWWVNTWLIPKAHASKKQCGFSCSHKGAKYGWVVSLPQGYLFYLFPQTTFILTWSLALHYLSQSSESTITSFFFWLGVGYEINNASYHTKNSNCYLSQRIRLGLNLT